MVQRAAILCTFLLGTGASMSAHAGVSNIQIVKGTCAATSHTSEGPVGSDLTKRQSRFYCDTAAITSFDDSPGHVLIHFSEKESHHSLNLGFSGHLQSRQPGEVGTMMQVSNVYLTAGQATPVSDGWCKLFSKDQQMSGIMCGMQVDEAGRRTVAIVAFDVSTDQSNTSASPPDAPIDAQTKTLADGTKIITLPNGNEVETLKDGTVWAILHPNNEMLAFQLDSNTMPATTSFRTTMILNLPENDILGAPQSERIQIEGDCQSRTVQIMGVLPYSDKDGGGLPDVDLMTQPEGVLRRVMPETPIWQVFDAVCKRTEPTK